MQERPQLTKYTIIHIHRAIREDTAIMKQKQIAIYKTQKGKNEPLEIKDIIEEVENQWNG